MARFAIKSVVLDHRECDSQIEITEFEFDGVDRLSFQFTEHVILDEDEYRLTDADVSLISIECENVFSNYGKADEEHVFARYLENYYDEMYFGNYDVIVKVETV